LDILIRHNLIEEQMLLKRSHKTNVVYAITERGRTALKYFKEVSITLQTAEEADKIPPLLY
jgi:predicted transcriptional regulator